MDIDESPKSAVQLITGPLRKSRSWKRIQNSNDNTVKPTYTNGKKRVFQSFKRLVQESHRDKLGEVQITALLESYSAN